jgi:hypothetical protein
MDNSYCVVEWHGHTLETTMCRHCTDLALTTGPTIKWVFETPAYPMDM